ncbi:MAG TPA: ABC transporter permease [Acidobacteriota bacterium]|nr:ABC transporter permease [Acidobacteriota bacterium]
MSLLKSIVRRLKTRLRPGRLHWEVEEEMSFHLRERTDEYRRSGLDADSARRRAQQRFGSLSRYRSQVLHEHRVPATPGRGANLMESTLQDIRFALRTLVRRPLFTVLCLLTLALGIGANTAIFSVVKAVLLAPLPYKDSESLAILWQFDRHNQTSKEAISVPDLFDFRERASSIEHLIGFGSRQMTLTGLDEDPERVLVGGVTPGAFAELGIIPLQGRGFEAEEGVPNGPLTVALRRTFAERHFGSAREAVGRTLELNGQTFRIVGVLPEEAPFPSRDVVMWRALQVAPNSSPRGNHGTLALARLAPGVTLEQANEEITSIAAQLEEEFPNDNAGRGAFLSPLREEVVGDYRLTLWVLMAAVGMVLLIACANVANLMLSRAASRGREVGIRRALGAGRLRLARQFLTESLLLAGVAALLGLGLAWAGIRVLLQLAPPGIPRLSETGLDPWVLGFTLVISLLSGVLFGLAPAFHSTRRKAASALRQGEREGGASSAPLLRRVLVVGEVALALMLVCGAGLLLRSLWEMQAVDPGFRAERLLKGDIALPAARYPQQRSDFPEWPEVQQFYVRLFEELKRLPESESFAFATYHPLASGFTTRFQVDGRPAPAVNEQTEARVRPVSPGYFSATGIQLLQGRSFNETDRVGAKPVMILNQAMARKLFPDEDPIGQRILMWGAAREVVGIADDVRFRGLQEESQIAMYLPLFQIPFAGGSILVRTSGDPEQVASVMRTIVRDLDPLLPLTDLVLLEDVIWNSLAQPRFNALLLSLFAATALLLALVGIFGVLSQTVTLRRREMGVRLALGARPADLMRSVVGQGLALTVAGIVLGIAGAWLAGRLISGMLFQVSALDPWTFFSVPLLLVAAALLACLIPARRAAGSDPLESLRCE